MHHESRHGLLQHEALGVGAADRTRGDLDDLVQAQLQTVERHSRDEAKRIGLLSRARLLCMRD